MSHAPFANLVEMVRLRAEQDPSKVAYIFLADGEDDERRLTYQELHVRACEIAADLQAHTRPGDRVLLLCPPGLEFIEGFLGCLYAGAIAVPAFPPDPSALQRVLQRIEAIAEDCSPAAILTTPELAGARELLTQYAPRLGKLNLLSTSTSGAEEYRQHPTAADDVAFLQYTSGSTGSPKGVVLTHENLLHNEAMINAAMPQGRESVLVSWLPLFHDMGLIGIALNTAYLGAQCVLMAPHHFLQRPYRWLRAITKYRGTLTGAPNFGFELCLRKTSPQERASIDLSSVEVMFNGAEPIRAGTLERFTAEFAEAGLRPEALAPCYGLAEATLMVSGAPRSARYRCAEFDPAALESGVARPVHGNGRTLVSSGRAAGDQTILIVDPDTRQLLPAGSVGEIWVAGPNVGQGYWQRPEASAEVFQARTASAGEDGGRYLRTGDLGFFHEGELYIAGRVKDLLIVRGRNLAPQDLERAAEEAGPALRPGCGAVFQVEQEDAEPLLVAVHEFDTRSRTDPADAIRALRAAVTAEFEVELDAVVLIEPRTIPKTSSGKIQRRACHGAFVAARFDVVARWDAPRAGAGGEELAGRIEEALRARIAAATGLSSQEAATVEDLGGLGVDSLTAVSIRNALQRELDVSVPLMDLLRGQDIAALSRRLADSVRDSSPLPALRSDSATQFPLSDGQLGLWYLHEQEPEGCAYNIPVAVRVPQQLDMAALRRTLHDLVERHEALRTRFDQRNGAPYQQVLETARLDLRHEDAGGWSADELRARLADDAEEPFDLRRDPLLRVRVYRRSDEDTYLLLVVHHIVSDFWSLAQLADELGRLYAASTSGTAAGLSSVDSRYADFVRWQSSWLGSREGSAQLDEWAAVLQPLPEPLELPTDRPRPPVRSSRGSSVQRQVDPQLTGRIESFTRKHGVTLYTFVLAAFHTLLHRYTGQTDLVVGSPVAVRERAEFADVSGLFVNTLPIRMDLAGDPTVTEVLARARHAVHGALDRQRVPFVRIVERIQPPRDASRNPVFDVMYVHQQSQFTDAARTGLGQFALGGDGARADLHGLVLESVGLERRSAQFDLLLKSAVGAAGLSLAMEFNTDLFDPATAERMLGNLEQLLRSMLEGPQDTVSRLAILTPAEQRRFDAWNATDRDYCGVRWTHEEFAAQAARTPEALALSFEGRSLDYRLLDQRSNQLAHRLQDLGVGPGDVVAIAMERSLELPVALLGVLKSGAAYLPLDPDHPGERLARMVADAAPAVVLTVERLRSAVPEGSHRCLVLDAGGEPLTARDETPPAVVLRPDDAAYVIYTSGSTGEPKGVVNTHGAIRNRLAWMQDAYGCGPSDRVAQKTPISFDVSVWELFWPLMHGATLVLARPGGHREPAYLTELFTRERVTIAHFVPTMLQLFLAEPRAASCGSLRQVIASGEALPAELARRFSAALPHCALDNLYGPTEAAVDVTSWRYRPDDTRDFVPIGRPIANVRIQLLDSYGNRVPVGVPGEIHIGGAALARGYHNRPELTAERFVPDPRGSGPHARLYRTGDLARYHEDGSIQYLGRTDHQVKLHGNRIELGEIESVLTGHPGVAEAVVTAFGTGADAMLVAYVTSAGGQEPPADELRAHLARSLPQYMVPHQFVPLAALPVTASGKTDRRALPAPDSVRRPAGNQVPPRTPEEQVLARVFGDVLGTDEVGVTDNFFSLGGDSIRALRVRVQARAAGLDFSIADLLRYQTIERLAKAAHPVAVEHTGAAGPRAPFSLLSEADRALIPPAVVDAYPLARLQEGLVFHSESSPDYEIYVMGFHFGGAFDEEAMRAALDRLAERHALLRTSFDFTRFSESVQLVHEHARIPLAVHDLTGQPAEAQQAAVDHFMRERKWRRFDWTKAPLLNIDVHVRSSRSFQCTFSHPLFDGWSMALLITELMQDYGSLARAEEPAPRPALQLGYADFVALEREAVQSAQYRDFWAGYLAGSVRGELPRWPSRRKALPARHRRTTVTVPRDVSDGLRRLAGEVGTSLKSVVLAAHLRITGMLTGRDDVTAGIIANGRPEELDGERVPGVFLNTIPLRMRFPGGTWRDLVRQTLDAEREVLPYRRYPLAELVRGPGGGEPLFETGFNYIHFHIYQALTNVDGLEVLDWSSPSDQTYFPLTAYFHLDISSGGLLCFLDLDDAVFDPDQVELIRHYYAAALTAMATDPDARYERQSLLPPQTARQYESWNATGLARPAGSPEGVHRRFASVAARRPSAVAVRTSGAGLTYAELETRSNQLAGRLRRLGAGPGSAVGISLGRGVELLVALLGVLKAGAAYVPMDPGFPRERLRHMLKDSGAAIVITDTGSARRLPDTTARLFRIDAERDALDREPPTAPEVPLDPGDLAYVIYTSGSTGVPKGVEISHRALDNLLQSFQRTFEWSADEVLLAVTTLSFDIAGLELFLPLTTGARVELATEDETADPRRLAERIEHAGVTTMQATPATWRMLMDGGWTGSPALRAVCGGEALTAELAEQLLPRCRELWNVYGPTETTIWSAAVRLTDVDGAPPIGRPLANTTFHVLDGHAEPVPLGTPGELYIGGQGLARGYRNRPDLTASAFVERVLAAGERPERLYRTGDLVRWRPDGLLEYLGRLDSQVKVRGFRIELGEIESVLGRQPSVRQAVVVARPGPDAQMRLVAYVTPRHSGPVDVRELRGAVAEQLPGYMVPGVYVVLDALPHTPNGKVDRKALPEPSDDRAATGVEYAAPQNEMEERLARMWREVLHVDRVGVDDAFFDLGGHSLLLVRLHSRMRDDIADIPLMALFEHPTVRGLAKYITGGGTPGGELERIRARAQRRRRDPRNARKDSATSRSDVSGGNS